MPPLALVTAWSPVEVLEELLSAWSPVVVVVLLLSDWSPVEVALSIVTLERPRRSICGLKLDVEPVTELLTSELDPVVVDVELEVEPVTEGLAALFVPRLVPAMALLFVPDVAALAVPSGMQSW